MTLTPEEIAREIANRLDDDLVSFPTAVELIASAIRDAEARGAARAERLLFQTLETMAPAAMEEKFPDWFDEVNELFGGRLIRSRQEQKDLSAQNATGASDTGEMVEGYNGA